MKDLQQTRPSLLINYNRPIGLYWNKDINPGFQSTSRNYAMGKIFVYPEILVPSTSGETGLNLTALSNTIYVAAREHNMSLSGYGHLDPVKFVIATVYVALLLEEIRRDLSLASEFQFGNKTLGGMLVAALTGDSISSLITAIPQSLVKFNMLVRRLNALYIPAIHLLEKWLPHRTCVYRDDEGDRYQIYAYRMANYYELDTLASSMDIGDLHCKWLSKSLTVANKLSLVEGLLSNYEQDQDMVNFAVEATKAGLPRIQLKEIETSSDKIGLPSLIMNFSIDDVLSLENAYFINPVYSTMSTSVTFFNRNNTWDIREDTTTGRFIVGRTNRINDRLPVAHPMSAMNTWADIPNNTFADPLELRPLFTHAQLTSEEGIYFFTRYIAGVANENYAVDAAEALQSYVHDSGATTISSAYATNKKITYLAFHSSTLLMAPTVYYRDADFVIQSVEYSDTKNICGMYVKSNSVSVLAGVLANFGGFKGTTYVYAVSWSSPTALTSNTLYPIYHDYDYIVNISSENFNQFHAGILWNDFTLLSGSSQKVDRPKFKGKKK